LRSAWYEHRGSARDGEVRIALTVSGVNPGDVKKRAGWQGSPMPFPRVIPHSDGAGTIDTVGPGVSGDRVGERVWCYGAQSYRPFGTAAEYVVVPDGLALRSPPAFRSRKSPARMNSWRAARRAAWSST
jgi:NADPH:quinone reductase